MHFSQIALWAGVLSLLQATTARPAVPKASTEAGTGLSSTAVTGSGSGAVNILDGEVIARGNGTEIQTFPNTSTTSSGTSSGTNWSLRYLGSSLPRLVSVSNTTSVKVGNYNVAFCDNLTTTVREDLQLLWENLLGVEKATDAGIANPAFQAFFKDNQYETFIQQMFVNITNGNALPKPELSTPEAPTIACLTGPGEATENTTAGVRDLFEICSGNPKYAAFYRAQSNWIFLCPEFFNFPQQTPQPASQYCPNVEDNYFVQAYWMNLVQNQMYILMHEILHYYLDSAPYPSTDAVTEVTDINVAFNLAALDAVSNAESYVIYDASKPLSSASYGSQTNDMLSGHRKLYQVSRSNRRRP